MPNFRKRPVVIEARQFTHAAGPFEAEALAKWCGGELNLRAGPAIQIKTLEGVMQADNGDWIIKGVKGEFYPCKPDIFAATYEPAE